MINVTFWHCGKIKIFILFAHRITAFDMALCLVAKCKHKAKEDRFAHKIQ